MYRHRINMPTNKRFYEYRNDNFRYNDKHNDQYNDKFKRHR